MSTLGAFDVVEHISQVDHVDYRPAYLAFVCRSALLIRRHTPRARHHTNTIGLHVTAIAQLLQQLSKQ